MNAKQLILIRKFQNLYRKKFNEELIIDFPTMNGITTIKNRCKVCGVRRLEEMDENEFNELIEKYNLNLDEFKKMRVTRQGLPLNILLFLIEFSNRVKDNKRYSFEKCARMLGRDRRIIYNYLTS